MRLKWLRTALSKLDQEVAHIAVDDAVTARVVVKRVLDAVGLLGEQAELGRPGGVHGSRELVVLRTRLIVPYRVRAEAVEILRVFHTSRRLPGRG